MQLHHNEGSLLFQMPHPSTHHCYLAYQSGRLVYTIFKTGKGYVIYVMEGIQHGFHIDINYSSPLQAAQYSMALASECPEIASGRNVGCFPKESIPDLKIKLMGKLSKGQGTLNYRFFFPEGLVWIDPNGAPFSICTSMDRADCVAQASERGHPQSSKVLVPPRGKPNHSPFNKKTSYGRRKCPTSVNWRKHCFATIASYLACSWRKAHSIENLWEVIHQSPLHKSGEVKMCQRAGFLNFHFVEIIRKFMV